MQRDTHKKYYQLHSWVGVVTSILLFVIAFTGAISVFGSPELSIWANPSIRHTTETDWNAIDRIAQEHAEEVGPKFLEEVRISPAGKRSFANHTFIYEGHFEKEDGTEEHRAIWFSHDPKTLELVERKEGDIRELFEQRTWDFADFIVGFHADLHLGNPIGLLLTGLLGLTLTLSIVTGVVIHKKILKELFTFRPFRSLRLMWQDGHKALSVWGILFHFAIAFSGAFLGLATVVLIPAAAYVSFKGDTEALVERFTTQTPPVISGEAAPVKVGETFAAAYSNPEAEVVFDGLILGWGDKNAKMYFRATGKEQMGSISLLYTPANGEFVETFSNFGSLGGVSGPMLDVMFPLHFGNFGGPLVKTIWAILGVGTALVALTGMMLWVERRAYGPEGQLSVKAYKRFSRLTVGSCGGLVIACTSLLHAQFLLNVPGLEMAYWLGVVFFSVWGAITLYAMILENEYRTTKELFALNGAILLMAAPLNWFVTGDTPLNVLEKGHIETTVIDVVFMLLGAWSIYGAIKLPSERQKKTKRTQIEIAEDNTPSAIAAE